MGLIGACLVVDAGNDSVILPLGGNQSLEPIVEEAVSTPGGDLNATLISSDSAAPVVRGWEIESVVAVKRPILTQLAPGYQGRRPAADEKQTIEARRGGFLIVQVQCKWASLQPPNEPLWVGRPDVVLVDDQGQEYPAVDALTRRGGEFVTVGMVANPARRVLKTERSRSYRLLAYFDVPNSARSFRLRFPDDGPVIPVQQLGNLPGTLVDLPD